MKVWVVLAKIDRSLNLVWIRNMHTGLNGQTCLELSNTFHSHLTRSTQWSMFAEHLLWERRSLSWLLLPNAVSSNISGKSPYPGYISCNIWGKKKEKNLCYCERKAWTYKPMIGMTCRKLIAAAKKGNPLKYNSAVHNTNNWSISNWNLQLLWALPGQDICKDRWNHSYLGRSCGDLELWRDDWGIIVVLEEALRGQLLFHHQPCL